MSEERNFGPIIFVCAMAILWALVAAAAELVTWQKDFYGWGPLVFLCVLLFLGYMVIFTAHREQSNQSQSPEMERDHRPLILLTFVFGAICVLGLLIPFVMMAGWVRGALNWLFPEWAPWLGDLGMLLTGFALVMAPALILDKVERWRAGRRAQQ